MFQLQKHGAAIAAVTFLTLAGCTATAAPSPAAACPDAPLRSIGLVDVTGSSFKSSPEGDYEASISKLSNRTAACRGDLWVATFGESSGQTVTLIDQSFQIEAPTENAQRRKREKLAKEAAATVRDKLSEAATRTPASATDVLGLLRLVEEAKAQHPDAAHEVLILTDGFTNVGVDPAAAASSEAAVALADQVVVPDLSGVKLTFAGIGRTNTSVPSSVVEQVTVFWKRVCERTQADSCTVATQWQGGQS